MALKAKADQQPAAAPAWVMTFADLMSLLMCFFVLLLSFSEMDAAKYKEVAGSMKFAFGIQREVKVTEKPKGVSIIAREYTPGKPQPTLERVLRQQTTDENREYIEILDPSEIGQGNRGLDGDAGEGTGRDGRGTDAGSGGLAEGLGLLAGSDAEGDGKSAEEAAAAAEARRSAAEDQARKLALALADEITDGLIEVEAMDDGVLIKVREQGSFPSGSAVLNETFKPVLDKIAHAISDDQSRVVVAGHTDDVPIATARYPSNWVLAASRATSVVHNLIERRLVRRERMEVRAYADTAPVASNANAAGRARNRRIEIFIGTPPSLDAGARAAMDEEERRLMEDRT